jgi:hypothetical protein
MRILGLELKKVFCSRDAGILRLRLKNDKQWSASNNHKPELTDKPEL